MSGATKYWSLWKLNQAICAVVVFLIIHSFLSVYNIIPTHSRNLILEKTSRSLIPTFHFLRGSRPADSSAVGLAEEFGAVTDSSSVCSNPENSNIKFIRISNLQDTDINAVGGTGHWYHFFEKVFPSLGPAYQSVWGNRPVLPASTSTTTTTTSMKAEEKDKEEDGGGGGGGGVEEERGEGGVSEVFIVFEGAGAVSSGVEELGSFGRFVLVSLLTGGRFDLVHIAHAPLIVCEGSESERGSGSSGSRDAPRDGVTALMFCDVRNLSIHFTADVKGQSREDLFVKDATYARPRDLSSSSSSSSSSFTPFSQAQSICGEQLLLVPLIEADHRMKWFDHARNLSEFTASYTDMCHIHSEPAPALSLSLSLPQSLPFKPVHDDDDGGGGGNENSEGGDGRIVQSMRFDDASLVEQHYEHQRATWNIFQPDFPLTPPFVTVYPRTKEGTEGEKKVEGEQENAGLLREKPNNNNNNNNNKMKKTILIYQRDSSRSVVNAMDFQRDLTKRLNENSDQIKGYVDIATTRDEVTGTSGGGGGGDDDGGDESIRLDFDRIDDIHQPPMRDKMRESVAVRAVDWQVELYMHQNDPSPCSLISLIHSSTVLVTPHGFQSILLLYQPVASLFVEIHPHHYFMPFYYGELQLSLRQRLGLPRSYLAEESESVSPDLVVSLAMRLMSLVYDGHSCVHNSACRFLARLQQVRVSEAFTARISDFISTHFMVEEDINSRI